MKLLVKQPGQFPEIKEFNDGDLLAELQAAVGGYIEHVPISDKLTLICDEEGKLKNSLDINIVLPCGGKVTDYVVGTVVVAAVTKGGDELRGLNKQEIAFAKNWLDVRSV